MGVRFVNNFNAPLAAGLAAGDTVITLQTGYGAILTSKLANPLGTDHIYGTLVNSANDIEIVKVTAISGDDLTVVRGVDNTTARPWLAGDIISMRACAASLMEVAYPTYESIYPIGSIYVNASVATNPAVLLGFGTWVAFGAGRVMVGFDATDSLFNAVEKIGGSKDAIVVAHSHTGSASSSGAHTHTLQLGNNNDDNRSPPAGSNGALAPGIGTTSSSGAHTHTLTVDSTGSSGTDTNVQPYITVYMWKRTA
jgi:hypothetical protein